MWKDTHYRTMLTDIDIVRDDPSSAIFLGVIVTYSRGSGPGRPPTWMIVDGQQRITTLYLTVMAAVYVAAINGDLDWAADTTGRYLIVRPMSGLTYNTKLVPSFNDRAQFSAVWSRVTSVKNLSSHSMFAYNPPRPPAPGGLAEGAMIKQFNSIVRDLNKVYKDGGLTELSSRIDIVSTKLSVVSISLREPTVAPKIFERLNFGAEPITVADLVRNEIFARSGDDLTAAQSLFDNRWEPFVNKFKDKNADLNKFLFPYALITNPGAKRNDLFITIRSIWDKLGGPAEIIDNLVEFQAPYVALAHGEDLAGASKDVNLRVKRLALMNRPSSIYPFVIPLLKFNVDGVVSDDVVVEALDVIESFLFRRAVSGIEPTGLHAVFKGMWKELVSDSSPLEYDAALSVSRIKASISERSTVAWPVDEEFVEAIVSGPLYRRKIAPYALREYEMSLEEECPADIPQIEHIAPQKKSDDWKHLTQEQFDKIVHTWGNLAPISPEMNPLASSKIFSEKKLSYAKSKFASVRKLSEIDVWGESEISARSNKIAAWAKVRWPH